MEKKYNSLSEFYPFYLTEHQDKVCRTLHFLGTGLVILLVLGIPFLGQWWVYALVPIVGYGFAWTGHFFFEKNTPATFQYPLWSLASDFIMFWHILTGQLPAKLKEAQGLL